MFPLQVILGLMGYRPEELEGWSSQTLKTTIESRILVVLSLPKLVGWRPRRCLECSPTAASVRIPTSRRHGSGSNVPKKETNQKLEGNCDQNNVRNDYHGVTARAPGEDVGDSHQSFESSVIRAICEPSIKRPRELNSVIYIDLR
ncbi:hypothetical protein EDD85DRAFT_791712 [Armillaria nabsnona]|nr:hypothetical protein EDD85DRAFT_791712 [Armillaria nabsnona]